MKTKTYKINKTYSDINRKIQSGDVVVVTAEEMVDIVSSEGAVEAARRVDVVTTGTFAPMCSSGAFINFGHSTPGIRASKVWLNNVPAYGGIAAVDCYIGATEPCEDDPLNKVHPGEFSYGGGHVIEDLLNGKKVFLKAASYGTCCYPRRSLEKEISLRTLPQATLCNPRNGYQNYNCAVNLTKKTIYTYMGTLKPMAANANYCSAGQLSPLLNDPYYRTIGLGTRIFLGGGSWICHLAGNSAQSKSEKITQRRSADTRRHTLGNGGFETDVSEMACGGKLPGIRLQYGCRARCSDPHSQRRDGRFYRCFRRGDFYADHRLWCRLPEG